MRVSFVPANSNHPASGAFEVAEAQGLRWAVVFDTADSSSEVSCFGEAPPMADENVRLASVSKLVVGKIFARLLSDDILREDQKAEDFLPEYAPELARVTLSDLASHQTGFRDALNDPTFRAAVNRDIREPHLIKHVLDVSLALGRSSERPAYSNTNAILLALCSERATGKSFAELLPAVDGLAYSPFGELPEPHPAGYRRGYQPGRIEYGDHLFEATHYNPSWSGPSGACTLRLDAIPDFVNEIVVKLTKEVAHKQGPYRKLMHVADGWAFHAGDVPGFSAWTGYEFATGRSVFVSAGLCWAQSIGNPSEYLARATIENRGNR